MDDDTPTPLDGVPCLEPAWAIGKESSRGTKRSYQPMHLRLHITDPEGKTAIQDLSDKVLPLVIGRDSEVADITILDGQASRRHCGIESNSEHQFIARDMGSRNGTWVNGRLLTICPLRHGDCIRIGRTHLTIECDANHPIEPLLGKVMGGYELQEVLGRGSFGTVFKGMQLALGRPVGIKVLAAEASANPEQVQSFLTEARRAGCLNHPNLLNVHDVLQVGDHHLLIMELMKCSATDLLRLHGVLDERAALTLADHIGRALSYAEGQRLVHRDVKPDNILLTEEGVYKLADLGIAAHISADGQAHQQNIFGSPHYVAPEQARGLAIDGRADIYGLGATIWHLVTGRPLFEGTNRELIAHHVNTPIPDLAELVPALSHDFVDLVSDMLEKDPVDRPPHAMDVVERAMEILSRPIQSAPVAAVRRNKRIRRRRYGR